MNAVEQILQEYRLGAGYSNLYGMKIDVSEEALRAVDCDAFRLVIRAEKDGARAYSIARISSLSILAARNVANLVALHVHSAVRAAVEGVKHQLHKQERARTRCFCVTCMSRRLRDRGHFAAPGATA